MKNGKESKQNYCPLLAINAVLIDHFFKPLQQVTNNAQLLSKEQNWTQYFRKLAQNADANNGQRYKEKNTTSGAKSSSRFSTLYPI